MSTISNSLVAGLAAVALSASIIATATPAAAQWRGPGAGWHGPASGWHAGRPGWGPRPGAWHGAGWRPGPAPGPGWGWHSGYWNGGVWYNGWWAPAVAAGLVAGAIATAPAWSGGYGGYGSGDGCWAYRPTYDGYGNYLGERWVTTCQ